MNSKISTIWPIEPHTQAKHEVLRYYLGAWFPILATAHRRLLYIDGFAGRGEYIDKTLGSPLIALQVADRLSGYFGKLICYFIEKDKDNFENLQEVLEREKSNIKNWQKIEVVKENDEFANVIEGIFNSLEEGRILIPSFFFVDPFGFSGIPFHIISVPWKSRLNPEISSWKSSNMSARPLPPPDLLPGTCSGLLTECGR